MHGVGQSLTLCVVVEGCLTEASAPHSKVRLREVITENLILEALAQCLPSSSSRPFVLAKLLYQNLRKSRRSLPYRQYFTTLFL